MQSLRRGFAASAVLALSMTLCAKGAEAQNGPAFDLQPGITVTDFVSVPEGTASNSAFSLRFSTRFPTSLKWLTPVVGAVFFPYGTTENTVKNTVAPTIFIGNILPLVAATRTAGWLSMEVPVLIVHSPGSGPSGNVRDYGRDIVILPTAYLHLGERALKEFGSVWSRLKVFVQLEHIMTPNEDGTTGDRDFFNPGATFGISLTIDGRRN